MRAPALATLLVSVSPLLVGAATSTASNSTLSLSNRLALGDPLRPLPPAPPYRVTTPDDPTISLLVTRLGGNYLDAYEIAPCIASTFMTAATHLTRAPAQQPPELGGGGFSCNSGGVEMLVVDDREERVHDTDALDLSRIMFLISKFHNQFMMPDVYFEVEYTGNGVSYAKIGYGHVVDVLEAGGANKTAVV